jgi:hypothetical protein
VVKPLQKYLTDELYATKKLTIRWVGGCGCGEENIKRFRDGGGRGVVCSAFSGRWFGQQALLPAEPTPPSSPPHLPLIHPACPACPALPGPAA